MADCGTSARVAQCTEQKVWERAKHKGGESAVNNRISFTQSQLLLQNSRQHGLLHACMR